MALLCNILKYRCVWLRKLNRLCKTNYSHKNKYFLYLFCGIKWFLQILSEARMITFLRCKRYFIGLLSIQCHITNKHLIFWVRKTNNIPHEKREEKKRFSKMFEDGSNADWTESRNGSTRLALQYMYVFW